LFTKSAMATERTFIALKPDAVQRGFVGEVISRFEKKGFKLVGLKLLQVSQELATTHYAEHKDRPFFPSLVSFITSGPVVAIVLEGKGVVAASRKLIGATNPLDSAPGTIRGDFGITTSKNLVHGSDSVESANREIALWFKPEELLSWNPTSNAHIYD